MMTLIRRVTARVAAVLTSLTFVSLVSPAVGSAIECGVGTIYDPPSDTLHRRSTSAASSATSAAASAAASLERRSDAVFLGGDLRAYSLRVVVHRYLKFDG